MPKIQTLIADNIKSKDNGFEKGNQNIASL